MSKLAFLNTDFDYEFRWSREFSHVLNPNLSSLSAEKQALCLEAANQFVRNFQDTRQSPPLEFLEGPEDSNLYMYCPVDTKGALSIVLAIDELEDEPEGVCVLANAGSQEEMKDWARDQYYDFDPILAAPLKEPYQEKGVLEYARRGDFEAWTQFLYPKQKFLAYKVWAGPACIEGAAGTGKTVIGLHYAATLARRYPQEKILFTTKRSALLTQFHSRFRRLSKVSNVDFLHVDKLAYDIIREIDPQHWTTRREDFGNVNKAIEQTFTDAYQCLIVGTDLQELPEQYLREEIESVIVGNGIKTFEEYLALERLGRLHSFSQESLKLIWSLHSTWINKLKRQDAPRFMDRLPVARDMIWKRPQGIYRSIIVDEIQDMPLVALEFIRALVAGPPKQPLPVDCMLLLGDPAQQIFPGGYSLAKAGIDLGDRSHVVYTNYRNTRPIYEAARAVRGNNCVTESTIDHSLVQTELESLQLPQFIRVEPQGDQQFIGDKIEELLQVSGFKRHQIGILTRQQGQAEDLKEYLSQQRGIECTLIAKDDTPMGAGVHLGSFNRTKGWEFRVVFIPFLAHTLFPEISKYLPDSSSPDSKAGAVQEEALILEMGRLYAAMTRARDGLYLIADAEPCAEILNARVEFDWRETI